MSDQVSIDLIILSKYMRMVRGSWLCCNKENFPAVTSAWSSGHQVDLKHSDLGPDLEIVRAMLIRAVLNQENSPLGSKAFIKGMGELNKYLQIARNLHQAIERTVRDVADRYDIKENVQTQHEAEILAYKKPLTAYKAYHLNYEPFRSGRGGDFQKIISRLCLHAKNCSNSSKMYCIGKELRSLSIECRNFHAIPDDKLVGK